MCLGSGVSWGYIPDDRVMTLPEVITMLVNVIVRDGNLLLNVGPDADGVIPAEMVSASLGELGRVHQPVRREHFRDPRRAAPAGSTTSSAPPYRAVRSTCTLLDTARLAKLPLVFQSDVLSPKF